jgi:hypothetical protein
LSQDAADRPTANFHIILCRRPYAVGGTNRIGPGRSSGRLAKLSEVAHRRKEVRIVPKGLSEKAEHLLRQVVILGEAYQREDVPWRILAKTTPVGEEEYEAVAEELVEAGLAESVDSDSAGLRATPAGRERVRGPGN